jgi:hypothetical protein
VGCDRNAIPGKSEAHEARHVYEWRTRQCRLEDRLLSHVARRSSGVLPASIGTSGLCSPEHIALTIGHGERSADHDRPKERTMPKAYLVGPNTLGGYHSTGHTSEFSVPDYAYPELGPDKTRMGSPARIVLWFQSWDDANEMVEFLKKSGRL